MRQVLSGGAPVLTQPHVHVRRDDDGQVHGALQRGPRALRPRTAAEARSGAGAWGAQVWMDACTCDGWLCLAYVGPFLCIRMRTNPAGAIDRKTHNTQVYDRLQDPCLLAQASTSTNKAAAVPTPKPQQEANAGQWISEGIRAPPSSTGSAAPSSSPSSVEGAVRVGFNRGTLWFCFAHRFVHNTATTTMHRSDGWVYCNNRRCCPGSSAAKPAAAAATPPPRRCTGQWSCRHHNSHGALESRWRSFASHNHDPSCLSHLHTTTGQPPAITGKPPSTASCPGRRSSSHSTLSPSTPRM